jgi:hypothetical protein
MMRDKYLDRLLEGAHVELYLSANDGARIHWPWRMQPPCEASKNYVEASETYVIDSDPLDNSVTTTDVLDKAVELDADVASLQDVYLDKEATVDSLLNGFEVADDHSFDGQLLLPLQAPYVECWQEVGEPRDHILGIGGLKDGTPEQRIDAATKLRHAVGPNMWIHGFGWGVTGIAETIRENPNLINSVDYSSPMQDAATNDASPGDEIMSVAAMQAAARLIKDLREVGSHPREITPEDLRDDGQAGLL